MKKVEAFQGKDVEASKMKDMQISQMQDAEVVSISDTLKKIHEMAKIHFLRDGFQKASLRQIVKDAGFTQGAFYGYYQSKEELFCDLVQETANGIFEILHQISAKMDQYPEESRMLHMSECYMNGLPLLVDFLFEHHEELILLMQKSEGTRYANFMGQIQRTSQSNTERRIKTAKDPLPLHPYSLQAIMDSYYSAVFHILLSDLSKEDTYQAMYDIQKFYQIGMMGLLKDSAKE